MSKQTTNTHDDQSRFPPEGMTIRCGTERCEPPDEENAKLATLLGVEHEYLEPYDEAREMEAESGFCSALAQANRDLGRAEGQENQFRIEYWQSVIEHLFQLRTPEPEEPRSFVGRVVPEQEVLELLNSPLPSSQND